MAAQRACHHPGAGCQRPLGLLFPSTSAHVRPSCDVTLPPDNTALLIIAELLLELRGRVVQQEGARPVTQMALFPAFFNYYYFFFSITVGIVMCVGLPLKAFPGYEATVL